MSDQTPTPDHGPLAATLSDRTLAKVLSRPAYVSRETPSLVELDQRDAANQLAYWAERALATLDPDSLLAGHLLEAITAYRETAS